MHSSSCYRAGGLLAALLGLSLSAVAGSGTWSNVIEYSIPTPNSGPERIVVGPDGALWFNEFGGNKIGRISTDGIITEYVIPTVNSGPNGITAGPDDALWFTEYRGNKIGRITTTGIFNEYRVGFANGLKGIAPGPDGALWFLDSNQQIGRISTAGLVTQYPIPDFTNDGITAGPDGALWFTELHDKIGRITTAGEVTEYPVTPGSFPNGIAPGPDGALWFAEYDGARIGRITTLGVVTEYPLPRGYAYPQVVAAGADGALWFSTYAGGIGRITTSGLVTGFPVADISYGITAGPDGGIWIVHPDAGKIGRAPACGLGFSTSFANNTLSLNFNLGTSIPATFRIILSDENGPFAEPFSQGIPAVAPPQSFTMNWSAFPNRGTITVRTALKAGPEQGLCAEWAAVDTAP